MEPSLDGCTDGSDAMDCGQGTSAGKQSGIDQSPGKAAGKILNQDGFRVLWRPDRMSEPPDLFLNPDCVHRVA
ncbi:hypothetical protein A3759_25195 [Thalassolituus sp. HI0120]|nr:hypothetical protein A3759_06380 [Thalassolituus sp. HI0120]KZZ50576.1 hypothetical protein A3759_25195 [Thalassolituus sp. HI0120]